MAKNKRNTLSDRISYSKTENTLSISIKAALKPGAQLLLLLWIIAWFSAGIIIISLLFTDITRDLKLYLFIYTFFWIYFAYKTIYTYLWRAYGVEKILIKDGKFYYKRDIKTYGKAEIFYLDMIKNLQIVHINPNSIVTFLSLGYWQVSGERLQFDYQAKQLQFGLELSDNEVFQLKNWIDSELKTRK